MLNLYSEKIYFLLLGKKDESLFGVIVKGDEKWIVYDDVRRIQNWKQVSECAEAADFHPVNVLASAWCDSFG